MPGYREHGAMSAEALRALPDWARERMGAGVDRIVEETCMYPDRYFDIHGGGHEKARPFSLEIDGIQFHYLPNTPIEGEYKYWRVAENPGGRRLERVRVEPNENWRHAWIGFNHYGEQVVRALRAGDPEEIAGFLGTLFHALQDASSFLHSLEGPDGTDLFVLNRLFDAPGGDLARLPSCLLRPGDAAVCRLGGYRPRLLGASVPEAAFRLYSAYAETVLRNRRRLVPMLLKHYADDPEGADAPASEILADAARLCADAAYTFCCIAMDRFDPDEAEALRRVFLSDLRPVREPRGLSLPYRFITYLRDAAMDGEFRRHPLALVLDGRRTEFAKGLGTGCHFEYVFAWELPAGVYRRFSCGVGLHPELSRNGRFTAEVRWNGKAEARLDMDETRPAGRVEVDTRPGGRLEWRVESPTGMGGPVKAVNNIVWADPVLARD